jgi:hypothetical protein
MLAHLAGGNFSCTPREGLESYPVFIIPYLDFLLKMNICLLTDDVTSDPLLDLEGPSPKVQYVREDGSVIPEDELQELSPVNLLAAAVNMVHRDESSEPANSESAMDHDPGNVSNISPCYLKLYLL